MKRIAFFVQWLGIGGVENSLIQLTNRLIKNGHDITVYLIVEKGEFLKKISPKVHLKKIPMPESVRNAIPVGGTKVTVRNCLQNKHYFQAAGFIIKHKLNRSPFAELNVDLKQIPSLDVHYDIAVNYHIHSPFLVWYLAERVRAEKKLTWIHNDFETTKYDIRALDRYLQCVDSFFGVSQKVVDEFTAILPEYRNRTSVALNLIPIQEVKRKAEEFFPTEYLGLTDDDIIILTVGRLEDQKGYDMAISICKKLVDLGLPVRWFAVGDGTLRTALKAEIHRLKLEEYFHILGLRMNPYPYYKNCTIYVQPSRHEAYVTSVTEAKIFEKPIVYTDVAGAREQLTDGISGDIANINIDSIFEKVERLIHDPERRLQYAAELRKEEILKEPEWISIFD